MFENAEVLDLTKVLDEHLRIYSDGEYRDPEFLVKTWCTIETQGYRVSQLSLGTQTGTHIDAPAHFKQNGATLETLPPAHLIGKYFFVDLDTLRQNITPDNLIDKYNNEPVLFLFSQSGMVQINEDILDVLGRLSSKVWAIAGEIEIIGKDPLFFHRVIAERGIYLIEDLDEETAKQVKPGGMIIALPLRLTGVSGSPCRVLVFQ